MSSEVSIALQNGLTSIALAVISLVGALAVAYLNVLKNKALAQLKSIDDERARSMLEDAIKRTADVVSNVVTSIEQEEKRQLIEATSDGIISQEDVNNLKQVAIDRVKGQLLPDTLQVLQDSFNDANAYISDLVSSKVFELKQSATNTQ